MGIKILNVHKNGQIELNALGGGNSKQQLEEVQSCEKRQHIQPCQNKKSCQNTEQQKVEISSEKPGVSITA